MGGTQDITGGLPRVTEIFEARRPRDPAVMAEVAGTRPLGREAPRQTLRHRFSPSTTRANRVGDEHEHLVPHGKHLRVHASDYVKEGDPLVDGPLVPHDILRICGVEAVQNYLVREVQTVYRSQRVDIDDKHIEIIVSQMLRKVKVETMGDTGLLPGSVIDKFAFREVNDRLRDCVKIKDPGDSKFEVGKIVGKEAFEEERAAWRPKARSRRPSCRPTPATCSTQLLGITKAAVQSDSFISAASFQETTKVLDRSRPGRQGRLPGRPEGERHPGPSGAGRHGLPHPSRGGSADSSAKRLEHITAAQPAELEPAGTSE